MKLTAGTWKSYNNKPLYRLIKKIKHKIKSEMKDEKLQLTTQKYKRP